MVDEYVHIFLVLSRDVTLKAYINIVITDNIYVATKYLGKLTKCHLQYIRIMICITIILNYHQKI